MHLLEAGEYSLDANVVVDFEKTDNLPLLAQILPGRMMISDFVAAELAEADIYYPDPAVVTLDSEEAWALFEEIRSNSTSLGLGEVAALAIGKLHGIGIITNDSRARVVGGELGIAVVGSLGLLEDAVDLGFLSPEAASITLDNMIKAGAWLSNALITSFAAVMKNKPR